ncbi:replication protein A 70 kDa DNA-binding subunit B, partial [Tanacetum coccineum]
SKEELQKLMMIVPVEEVYVEASHIKYPIIDWEIYSEDTRRIIRVGNHTEAYQTFDDMVKKFDRDDLDKLWSLVKERFSSTDPTDDKERTLWVELKRLFKPDIDDILWNLQRYMHDPLTWRLYDTCGVHHVSTNKGHDIFMLVEKDYPLTRGILTLMLCNKLQVDQHSEMGSRISATIGNKMVSQFESLLKEGGSLNLSNFYVVKNNTPYKVANHPFKINFHKKTKVKAIQLVFSSKYGFSFVPFTEFVEDNVKKEQVVDVIRLIAAVGDVVYGERKGKKNRRMVVELQHIKGLKLKCTLWDAFIDDFKTRMKSSSDHIKVCIFQFGSVRKSRLLARGGDDTSSFQVSNLTSESAEALEEKSFFYGMKYVNLEQLMDVVEVSIL